MARGKWEQQGRFDADASSRRLDNLALVPASLLPHRTTYQRLANQLPAGAVLVVLPTEPSPERQTSRKPPPAYGPRAMRSPPSRWMRS
jgi:hypothetical protein